MNEFFHLSIQGILANFTGSAIILNDLGKVNPKMPLIGFGLGILFYIFTYKQQKRNYNAGREN